MTGGAPYNGDVCIEAGDWFPYPEELANEITGASYDDYWYDDYWYSEGPDFDPNEVAYVVEQTNEQLDGVWDDMMYVYYDVKEICDEVGCWDNDYYDDYWYDDYYWYEDYANWEEEDPEMCQAENDLMMGAVFAFPDTNNDGAVTYDELSQAFDMVASGDLLAYLTTVFEQFDEDQDEELDAYEWSNFVNATIDSGELFTNTPLAQPVTDAEISALQAMTLLLGEEPIEYNEIAEGLN